MIRDKWRYETQIVICVVGKEDEFNKINSEINGAYIYLKSEDNKSKAIHWMEPCKYPWSSMSIQSNGDAVGCSSDFDSENLMGDTNTEMLWDIWNGEKYEIFRKGQSMIEKCQECSRRLR